MTIALQHQHHTASPLRSRGNDGNTTVVVPHISSFREGGPRVMLIHPHREKNAKHSLLGRMRLSYARRGASSSPSCSHMARSEHNKTPTNHTAATPLLTMTVAQAEAAPHHHILEQDDSVMEEDKESHVTMELNDPSPSQEVVPSSSSPSSNQVTPPPPACTTNTPPTTIPTGTLKNDTKAEAHSTTLKRFRAAPVVNKKGGVVGGVLSGSLVGAKRRYVQMAEAASEDGYYYSSSSSDDDEEESSTSSFSLDQELNRHRRAKKQPQRVHFHSLCLVTEIPHHSEYSSQQRQQQWNGRKTIKLRARINSFEYQYDGWDCEQASEEDQFVELPDGEKCHPAHQQLKGRGATLLSMRRKKRPE